MVVDKFLTTTPEYITQLRDTAAAGDCEALREKSHTLKSSTAMIGATRLSALCRSAEAAARRGDAEAAAALTDEITDEYERVEAALATLELGGANAA